MGLIMNLIDALYKDLVVKYLDTVYSTIYCQEIVLIAEANIVGKKGSKHDGKLVIGNEFIKDLVLNALERGVLSKDELKEIIERERV